MTLKRRLQAKRLDILKFAARHGATNARIFGSVARDEDSDDSDIDLLVELEPERSLIVHVALIQDLEDMLNCKVDVVTERTLNDTFRDRVLKDAIPL